MFTTCMFCNRPLGSNGDFIEKHRGGAQPENERDS